MKDSKSIKEVILDLEEQAIEEALPDTWEALPFSKEAATNYLRKDKQVNIRLSNHDVDGLKRIATREGLRYQTLISSILHKFVSQNLSI